MFDISFPELFFIVVVAILVFGPQDIPKILYGLGRIVRRLQYLRFSFSQQFESFMQHHSGSDAPGSVNFETLPPPARPLSSTKEKTQDRTENTAPTENNPGEPK